MRKISKFLTVAALLAVFVFLFAACPNPIETTPSGYFLWERGDDGTIIITGYDQNGPGAVIIPGHIHGHRVSTIGTMAFFERGLTSVTIPPNTTIRADAFSNNQLTRITLGENVILNSLFGNPPFGSSFDTFFNNNNRKAGTYTWDGRNWSFQD